MNFTNLIIVGLTIGPIELVKSGIDGLTCSTTNSIIKTLNVTLYHITLKFIYIFKIFK